MAKSCCLCKRDRINVGTTLLVNHQKYFLCTNCTLKMNTCMESQENYDETRSMLSGCDRDLAETIRDKFQVPADPEAVISRIRQKENLDKKRREEEERIQDALKNRDYLLQVMPVTTTPSFKTHTILKYLCPISGESVLGTGFFAEWNALAADLTGGLSDAFSDKLKQAKETAMDKLRAECIIKGGNAIVGVDFDYITFHNNMIGVIANGTAVIVENPEE